MSKFPQYKTVPVGELVPYARNSRTHSDAQVAQIAASIREFGFLNPIIVDGDSGIIAGHGRVLAARLLGLDTLPCIEAAHLTEAQRKAYVLADNQIALNAGWDNELLRVELGELGELGFDLALTGFSLEEIESLNVDPEPEVDSGMMLRGAKYQIIVDADDETMQARLLDEFEKRGLSCRALML